MRNVLIITVILGTSVACVTAQTTTTYKPGARGAYGQGGAYVAPATTKTYTTPTPSRPAYTPPATRSSPSSNYSSPSSTSGSRSSDRTSSSYKEHADKATPTATEVAAFKDKQQTTYSRIQIENKELEALRLFCKTCGAANFRQVISNYMTAYPTPDRYVERPYVPASDLEALRYVSARVNPDLLNSIPEAEAMAFMDRLHWQLRHLFQPDKIKELDLVRTNTRLRFLGITPTRKASGPSGTRKIVSVNSKFGYENEYGDVVIAPQYDMAYNFKAGIAVVQKGLMYGFIDSLGKVIEPFEYTNLEGKGDHFELTRNGKTIKFRDGKKFE